MVIKLLCYVNLSFFYSPSEVEKKNSPHISHIQDKYSPFRTCFPPTARSITFRNLKSEQKHVYKNEGNNLDAINLNAHIGLFLFASVHVAHNLSPRKVALSGTQYVSEKFNLTWMVAIVTNL